VQDVTTVDFETDPIEKRPKYPPRPAGMAIRDPGGKKEYLAFAHPSGNNCSFAEARRRYYEACRGTVLFHNGAFDMDIGEAIFGLRPAKFEDSLYLCFLNDPYSRDLGLKPQAEKELKMPPDEQTELRDWIIDNVPGARKRKTKWGEFISAAPGDIVAPYAVGDVSRTYMLWKLLRPKIEERGMLPAYQREIDLTKTTIEMERSGVRVDVPRLKDCLRAFEKLEVMTKKQIHRRLNVGSDFKLSSSKQLAEALLAANKLDAIMKTKTGLVSTRIANLKETCNDKRLLELLSVHSVVQKYASSFLRPWIAQAEISGGRILPTFNQCRGRDEGGGGARSGRYSSSDPNLQNVATNAEESKNKDVLLLLRKWLKEYCDLDFIGLRDYILPDEGSVMICIDYSQQELRILAHFEKGVLMEEYNRNPELDVHEFVRQLIFKVTGVLYERKHIKTVVFGIIYGMGVAKLAAAIGVSSKVAKNIRDGIYVAIPGIKAIQKELQYLAAHDKPLTTWGGREYFCEEPRYNQLTRQWMSFEYKMLNYLIQPSAADCTKQGMLNVRDAVPEARIAIQVHDELVCMAPSKKYGPKIAAAMCDVKMRVPMLAEPKYSTDSWARAA